ncbi:response regulator transcription factor [Azorhizobium doebereinerae]|uniref:response regulator transcription factor n=1 Tax=Azorhizobium doebereinerae TaxID=281091 RepID=UPI0004158448|nr:response regulator [Azorhizobium doebereinerae]
MTARILLVEDDFLERSRLESALVHLGYEVVGVGDGDGALARLASERFDLMLLDLVLPGLDGMGVLGALKARGETLPVVAAVTSAGLDAAASALRAGARDFVVKPAGTLRLRVAITNALALAAAAAPREPASEPQRGEVPHLRLAHDADRTPPAAATQALEAPASAASHLPLLDALGHVRSLEQVEAEVIRAAVSLYGGRMSEVARRLGMGRSTLYRKLSALGLPVQEPIPALAVAAE